MQPDPLATNKTSPYDCATCHTTILKFLCSHWITHTQSASLSRAQFCTTTFAHMRITINCVSLTCTLTDVSLHSMHTASFALLAELGLLLPSCANLPVRTVNVCALCCMCMCICYVALHASLTALQHWLLCTSYHQRFAGSYFDKLRYTLGRVVGSGNYSERLLLQWNLLQKNPIVLMIYKALYEQLRQCENTRMIVNTKPIVLANLNRHSIYTP